MSEDRHAAVYIISSTVFPPITDCFPIRATSTFRRGGLSSLDFCLRNSGPTNSHFARHAYKAGRAASAMQMPGDACGDYANIVD